MSHAIERVVVINDDSVPSGGAAGIMLASIRQLRAREVPVTLLTGDDGANPELADLGVDVVSLGGRHILEGGRVEAAMRGLYARKTAQLLQAWIDAHDTPGTVYHLHNWHKVLSPAAFVPLRQVAARLVLSAHDYFLACPNGGYYHYPKGKACDLEPLGLRCVASACDKRNYAHKLWRVARGTLREMLFSFRNTPATVLAVHDGMIPLLERGGIGRHCIEVLRNPVTPWRSSRVAAEQNQTFLFVGRLEEDKGVTLLAQAARRAGGVERRGGGGGVGGLLQARARARRVRERVRPLTPEPHDLGAVEQTLAGEADELGLLAAPPRQRGRPLASPAQLVDLLAALEHAAVDETGDDGRQLSGDDGHHRLVQEREPLLDRVLPDAYAPRGVQRQRQQVGVVEMLLFDETCSMSAPLAHRANGKDASRPECESFESLAASNKSIIVEQTSTPTIIF